MPPLPSVRLGPGCGEPPALGHGRFCAHGEPLGEGGLDPWPEALLTEVSADDVVETIGDEDVVEELTTPPPASLFPAATPPGSGGIRGFQFPKPPPGPVPSLYTARLAEDTAGRASCSRVAIPSLRPCGRRAEDASAGAAAAAPFGVAPRAATAAARATPPPPVALRTPVPTPAPTPASAVAPATPRPTPGPGAKFPRPLTPVPGRMIPCSPRRLPRQPCAPVLTPKVECPRGDGPAVARPRGRSRAAAPRASSALQPTPSPAQGTVAVFGPP